MSTTNDPVKAREYFAAKLQFTAGPADLKRMLLRNENVRVIDVRAAGDFVKEHIPGSTNLPRAKWATAEGLSKDALNVIVCYSQVCHLAAMAAVELAGKGFPVMELEGGFRAWKELGNPTEAGSDGVRARVEQGVDELRAMRDEIRVRLHLASLDARTAWNELEPKLEDLETKVVEMKDDAHEAMEKVVDDLTRGFRALRDKLM